MNKSQIDRFEKTVAQIQGVYDELSVLSKKSPNDAVNKFKLRFVNELLAESNKLLGKSHRPFSDFEQFADEELPKNSDVVFILSQYLQCFEKMRADNIHNVYSQWYWMLDGAPESQELRTTPPKKLQRD